MSHPNVLIYNFNNVIETLQQIVKLTCCHLTLVYFYKVSFYSEINMYYIPVLVFLVKKMILLTLKRQYPYIFCFSKWCVKKKNYITLSYQIINLYHIISINSVKLPYLQSINTIKVELVIYIPKYKFKLHQSMLIKCAGWFQTILNLTFHLAEILP